MMAKMFYTLDETKVALGKDDDEIKQFTRDGRLREFRDGPRLMFKADQVETLKSEIAGGGRDQVDLGPSDTGAPIGLVDSRSGSGAMVSLSDTGGPSSQSMKEDTALAADLGLSGSIGLSNSIGLSGSVGGLPSPGRPGGSGSGLSGLSGSSAGSKSGINILGDDDSADPSAQTSITPAVSDQINLEGMGSGSGLLDLTREGDNTSLGAVLDEIPGGSIAGGSIGGSYAGGSLSGGSLPGGSFGGGSMGGTRAGETIGSTTGSGMAMAAPSRVITPPTYVEARDGLSPALGGAALFTTFFAFIGLMALGGGVLGVRPGLLDQLNQSFAILAGIGAGIALVGFVGGLVLGKVRG